MPPPSSKNSVFAGEGSTQLGRDGLSAESDLHFFVSVHHSGKEKIRTRVEAAGGCGQAETRVDSGWFLEDKEERERRGAP